MLRDRLIQLFYGFMSALIFMALPWPLAVLAARSDTIFMPLAAVVSVGAFLFLLARNVLAGQMYTALGVLLMLPASAWIVFGR